MNTLSIDGWRKADNDSKSIPIGTLQFYVSEAEHLRLERAEEELQRSGLKDTMIDADMQTLEVEADVSEGSLSKVKVGQPRLRTMDCTPYSGLRIHCHTRPVTMKESAKG